MYSQTNLLSLDSVSSLDIANFLPQSNKKLYSTPSSKMEFPLEEDPENHNHNTINIDCLQYISQRENSSLLYIIVYMDSLRRYRSAAALSFSYMHKLNVYTVYVRTVWTNKTCLYIMLNHT